MSIKQRLASLVHQNYPKNYLLQHPLRGAIAIALICFLFMFLYKPLNAHKSGALSYAQTMAIYCTVAGLVVLLMALVLRRVPYFSNTKAWTLPKELLAILIVLFGTGVGMYFLAFALEPPADRWNLHTFADSCIRTFLLGIVPFSFFTLSNYRFLRQPIINKKPVYEVSSNTKPSVSLIHIESKLKKEDLSFHPDQFLFAESDGNYVIFHLQENGEPNRKMIRNSISNIEKQLSDIPYLLRTHRAFIVNLKKIRQKQGNTSGYRLQLDGSDAEIPVSRQNVNRFNKILQELPR